VIARRLEWAVDAAKNALALVADLRQFAVHRNRRTDHFATESVADRLMAEADAEDRNLRRRFLDQVKANAGFLRRARPGRQHDGVGLRRHDGAARHFVVAMHDDIRTQLPEIVDEVEREAVVVVDKNDHSKLLLLPRERHVVASPTILDRNSISARKRPTVGTTPHLDAGRWPKIQLSW